MFTHPFDHLVHAAQVRPAGLALVSEQTEITYAELLDSALRFARIFRESGVQSGQLIGVRAQPLIDLVVSEAVFHEGAVGSHVPVEYGAKDLRIFDWVVTETPLPDVPLEKQLIIDQAFLARSALLQPTVQPNEYPDEHSLCRVSFSSGTTGTPKAIGWSIRCLEDRALERRHQWMLDTPFLCLLGLSTGLGFMTFFEHVERMEPFIIPARRQRLLDQILKQRVSCLIGSPQQLHDLLQAAALVETEYPHLSTIMSAGSALPDALTDKLQNRFGAKIVSTYASSEAGSVAVRHGAGTLDGFAGIILDDVEVTVEDEDGRPLPEGEVGRIGVRRAHQPSRYLFDDVTSKKAFRDGYFFSGDLGMVKGRELYLAGRESEVIHTSGIKVDPARVESVAFELSEVRDAAAFGFQDESGLRQVGLVVVSEQSFNVERLISLLKQRLGEASPSRIARVENISRNHMGKVNRSELAKLLV